MKRYFIIVMMLSLSLIVLSASISVQNIRAEEPNIKIAVFNFPPFYVVEEGKEPSGILIDYIQPIFQKASLKYTIKGYPPKRLYNYLATGEADIFLGIKGVPELEGNVLYSNEKVLDIDLRIYSREGVAPITTKEEMRGKRIITIRGYSYGGFINYIQDPANNIVSDMSNTHELAFKKLQAQRADYVLDYSTPSEKALASINIPRIQSHSMSLLEVVFIISKKTPNGQELLTALEKAFVDLKKEGKFINL